MRTVLFVCTGNTCRSPMAEAIARHVLLRQAGSAPGGKEPLSASSGSWRLDQDVFVASAGVGALDGVPTTHETVQALRRMGIDFEGRSKRLSEPMIRKATFVVCMTTAHQATARRLVADSPSDQARIVVLDPQGGDIEDPIGMGQREYDALAMRLSTLVPQRLRDLLGDGPGARADADAGSTHTKRGRT